MDPALDVDEPVVLEAGQRADVVLRWAPGSARLHRNEWPRDLAPTVSAWRRWAAAVDYEGPQRDLVRRSALAVQLYDSLCQRAGPLGLLPEEIDPGSGEFLGNYPQAFSHIGVISSGINLARCIQNRSGEKELK